MGGGKEEDGCRHLVWTNEVLYRLISRNYPAQSQLSGCNIAFNNV